MDRWGETEMYASTGWVGDRVVGGEEIASMGARGGEGACNREDMIARDFSKHRCPELDVSGCWSRWHRFRFPGIRGCRFR